MTSKEIPDEELLAAQIRYYEARAPTYEQLYFLRGDHAVADEAFIRAWRRRPQRSSGSSRASMWAGPCWSSHAGTVCGPASWLSGPRTHRDRLVQAHGRAEP